MGNRRVTSRHVAERAGVSRTTVSFVLNGVGSGKVSAATQERVLQAARDLGYVPDAAARSLVSGKTATMGLLIARSRHIPVDAFIPLSLRGLSHVCQGAGFRLIVETSDVGGAGYNYAELVDSRKVDGLVVLNADPADDRLTGLIDRGFPLVLIGGHPDQRVATVSVDSVAGMRAVTEHLVRLGHREIAFIHYREVTGTTMGGRLAGYRAALEAVGIEPRPRLVRSGDFSAESGHAAMMSLLAERPRLSAVVCGNDTIAIGAMSAIARSGMYVPDDIAVVGFDDIPLARFTVPALTTVRLPAEEMARRAGEMAMRLINGGDLSSYRVRLPTELVVRQSSGAGVC